MNEETQNVRFDGRTLQVPRDALRFTADASTEPLVEFIAADGVPTDSFRMQAYSGGRMPWLFGDIVIDVNGIKLDKGKGPKAVLLQHNPYQRVGFGKPVVEDNAVHIEGGKFLSNKTAKSVQQDARDGFPFQASVSNPCAVILTRLPPLDSLM